MQCQLRLLFHRAQQLAVDVQHGSFGFFDAKDLRPRPAVKRWTRQRSQIACASGKMPPDRFDMFPGSATSAAVYKIDSSFHGIKVSVLSGRTKNQHTVFAAESERIR